MHKNNFNLLRLLFAVGVIFSHSFELLRHQDPLEASGAGMSVGTLGVCGFFLLSGYLTAQSWTHEPRALAFLKKRALRLYPAFIAASVLSVFVVGPLGASTAQYFSDWSAHKFFADLIGLRQPRTPEVFANSPVPSVNGSMWTITFELRCYLLMTVLGLCGVMKRRWAILLLAVAVNAAAIAGAPMQRGEQGDALFGVSGFMLWFASLYLAGVGFYLLRERLPLRGRFAVFALLGFGAALFATAPVMRAATVTLGAYCLFYIGQRQSPLLQKLRMRDDLSYGLYLYGWPVTQLLALWLPSIAPLALFACVSAICVPIAFVSWRGVEAPALRLKPAPTAQARPVAA
ncbi:peptidoglycan/LPS O-acetylase OafA/YrhL [Paraburkholderia bannensis]|uniref:Peptidoglycan/LPS O-acetylase OafA/YrhL n=1 Tax=Paraburkholderia bannensis TaxID=765414 RepID=A0A7W9TZP7_9BURK|nr:MULTISPECIES: acyltransferase [Paraburkholderia]MBB6104371.1 peptidoglycan/LPS O-acetylase OafA/YrhL [Paraburkholderia bannensis]